MAKQWTKSQLTAINAEGGRMLVSAGAGSGKTSVLVQRVIRMITGDNPVPADKLLIITFTRAAAAELKQRVFTELARQADSRTARRQTMLLRRAQIGTMDAFCGALVKDHFNDLDIQPDYIIGDPAVMGAMRAAALDEALEELYDGDEGFRQFAYLFGRASKEESVGAVIDALHCFLDSSADRDAYKEFCLRQLSLPYKQTIYFEKISRSYTDFLRDAVALVGETEKAYAHSTPRDDKGLVTVKEEAEALRLALQFASEGDYGRSITALSMKASTRMTYPKSDAEQLIRSLRGRYNGIRGDAEKLANFLSAEQYSEESSRQVEYVEALFRAEKLMCAKLDERKRASGMYEFSDIARLALSLLVRDGKKTPLAAELSERYVCVMIDEHQDTNEMQNAIFAAVSTEGCSNQFVVGDVKQSVYGFRDADYYIFCDLADSFEPSELGKFPMRVLLRENFRCTNEVAEGINRIFDKIMLKSVCNIDYSQQRLICGTNGSTSDGVGLEMLFAQSDDQPTAVAARIKALVEQGFMVNYDGGMRRCGYGDFCILLRARSDADDFVRACADAGIPTVNEGAEAPFASATVSMLLSALEAVSNPGRSVALAALMTGERFSFTADDFLRLRPDKGKSLYSSLLSHRSDEKVAQLLRFLREKRRIAARLRTDDFVRILSDELDMERAAFALEGEHGVFTLRVFLEFATAACASGRLGINGLISAVQRAQKNKYEFRAPVSAARDKVSIRTIHSAKGLEWPIVIIPKLEKIFSNKSYSPNVLFDRRVGLGMRIIDTDADGNRSKTTMYTHAALANSIKRECISEEMRLLYVGLTRARDKLLLYRECRAASAQSDVQAMLGSEIANTTSYGKWIMSALGDSVESPDMLMTAGCRDGAVYLGPAHVSEDVKNDKAPSEGVVADSALAARLAERLCWSYQNPELAQIPSKMTVSELTHTEDVRSVRRPKLALLSGMSAAERGTALHEFMQYADYSLSAGSVRDELLRLCEKRFIDDSVAEGIDIPALERLFSGELMARIRRSPRVLREYEFFYELDGEVVSEAARGHKIMVQGISDCVFEEDGKLVIVDYKSDRVNSPERLKELYAAQVDVYRNAVSERLGMEVSACLLYSFALDCTVRL